jgi:hypothetical protein
MDRITSFQQSSHRYSFLRIIGALFSLIGAVELTIGGLLLAFALYTLLAATTVEPSAGVGPFTADQVRVVFHAFLRGPNSLLLSCAFLLSGLYFAALGGVIRLLIHLERNVRAFAQSLDKIRMSLESRRAGAEPSFRA